jgi:hypothetical protein
MNWGKLVGQLDEIKRRSPLKSELLAKKGLEYRLRLLFRLTVFNLKFAF